MRNAWRTLAISAVLLFGASLVLRAKADNSEVKSYKFAETEGDTVIYKAVHEGCELYIAENKHFQFNRSDSVSVSITTGRGCK